MGSCVDAESLRDRRQRAQSSSEGFVCCYASDFSFLLHVMASYQTHFFWHVGSMGRFRVVIRSRWGL
jgi:hypothetical protein